MWGVLSYSFSSPSPPQGSEQMNLIAQHAPQLVSSWSKLIICFNFCQEIKKKEKGGKVCIWREEQKQREEERLVNVDYPTERRWK